MLDTKKRRSSNAISEPTCQEKKRRTVVGGKRSIDYGDYCEHLNDLSGSAKREFQASNGNYYVTEARDFDHATVERIDMQRFLDNLSDEEEYYGAIQDRMETLRPDDPSLNRKDRRKAEKIVGFKHKVPLTNAEKKAYDSKMLSTAWKPTDSDMNNIRSNYNAIRSLTGKRIDPSNRPISPTIKDDAYSKVSKGVQLYY